MILTPHTDITATYGGVDADTGMHSYTLRNAQSGAEETIESAYGPEDDQDSQGRRRPGFKSLMGVDFNTPKGRGLASTLSQTFKNLQHKDQRGFFTRAIAPVLRSVPAYFAGAGPDILGLLSYVPGPKELIAMGYEAATGDDPFGMLDAERKRDVRTRKGAEKYGSKAQQLRFQKYLRAADKYAEDKWGFKPFEASVGTDMTPETRDIWEKMVTSGLEFAVSGPVMMKGVTLPAKVLQDGAKYIYSKLAKDSVRELGEDALKPENVRSIIDKANDAYSLFKRQGRRNIGAEAGFGAVAGPSVEASLYGLEQADPDAAGWVKTAVSIGSGLLVPIAAKGTFTTFLQGPIVKLGTKAIIDPLFRPGKSAVKFSQEQGIGKSKQDRAGVASVARLLEEAVEDGRHVDQASGLAFTTPELARSEANILRAEIQFKRERLSEETDPEIKARLEKEIETDESTVGYLNRTANFHENVLQSAANDSNIDSVNRFFQAQAERLKERREQFFNYIENNFKKSVEDLNFGGKRGGSVEEHNLDYQRVKNQGTVPEFEETRRRLVVEGDPRGVEASELTWLDPQTAERVGGIREDLSSQMDEAFSNAQKAAEDRVRFWEDAVQSHLADRGLKSVDDLSGTEKDLVGDLIRGTYDDAYREFRAFEKAAYRRIDGLEDKVTDDIVFPKGSKNSTDGSDISGMTVEEWATGRLENLSRTEKFNLKEVPVQLAQLVGSRSVITLINRRRKAASQAEKAQAEIPDLERQRDDAISRRVEKQEEIKLQQNIERQSSERLNTDLQRYMNDTIDNHSRFGMSRTDMEDLVDKFYYDPEIDWATITRSDTKRYVDKYGAAAGRVVDKRVEGVFAEIAAQRKEIQKLGEGVTSSAEIRNLDKELKTISKEATDAQSQIDDITKKFLGAEDAVLEQTGRLTSRTPDGTLVDGGTSANDVKETISDIAEAARREVALNGKTPKYRSLIQVRKTLEQLLSVETFRSLNPSALTFAREASRLKNRVDEAQGDILGKDKSGTVRVPVEEAAKVLPESPSPLTRAARLRVVQEATADLPDFVSIKRGDDGQIITDAENIPIAVIDEKALDGRSLFELPESPFELVRVGEGRTPFELRLKPDFPVSEKSLQVAESIILERLALRFSDGVDSKSLDSFRNKNREAIQFLENNGRGDIPSLLKDGDELAIQLDALKTLRNDKTRKQLNALVDNDQLDLQGLTIDDYLDYIGQRRTRLSEENAFSEILNADAGYGAETLFKQVMDPKNNSPKSSLNEFLSLVRGSPQAERGLQASIIGELFRRSITKDDALKKAEGSLSASAFDPVKFRDLISNPRVRSLLQEAFPNNAELLPGLEKMALAAFETSTFTTGGVRGVKIDPQNALSNEAWNNLGRLAGLQFAERVGFVNSLVAAGAGGRMFGRIGQNITGNKIKDILINAALDPRIAVGLSKATSQSDGFFKSLAKAAIDTINVPGAIARRPAASIPILLRGEEEFDEPGGVGPSAAVTPQAAPQRRVSGAASFNPQRVPNSALATANPVGPPPTSPPANPQQSAQTLARLNQLGMPLFRGSHGGYVGGAGSGVGRLQESNGIMSVKRKARQLVG